MTRVWRLLMTCLVFAGCSSVERFHQGEPPPPVPGGTPVPLSTLDSVRYFYGPIHFSFSDGRHIQSRILLERRLRPEAAQIIEHFWQPPGEPGRAAAQTEFTLTLVQKPGPGGKPKERPDSPRIAEFTVYDEHEIAEGTEVFQGPDWNWTGWNYALRTRDGVLVRGQGQGWSEHLEIHKVYYRGARDLARRKEFLRIDEELREIQEPVFRNIRDQMQSGLWGL